MHSKGLTSLLLSITLVYLANKCEANNPNKMLTIDEENDDFDLVAFELPDETCGRFTFQDLRRSHRRLSESGNFKQGFRSGSARRRAQLGRHAAARIADAPAVSRTQSPSLVRVSTFGSRNPCSGTLIHPRVVLTAAQCLTNKTNPWVTVTGRNEDEGDNATYSNTTRHKVDYYCLPRIENADIAMLVLSENMELNPRLWPACLSYSIAPDTNKLFAVGLGETEQPGGANDQQRMLEVKMIDCDDSVPFGVSCWRPSNPEGRGSACPGDTGGALYRYKNGKQYLDYVISYDGDRNYVCDSETINTLPGLATSTKIFRTFIDRWLAADELVHKKECFKAPYQTNSKN